MSTLGTLIRTKRLSNGFSLRGLASVFEVTHSTIKAWEDDRKPLGFARLVGVCNFLGVDFDEAHRLWKEAEKERDRESVRRLEERLAARRARRAAA